MWMQRQQAVIVDSSSRPSEFEVSSYPSTYFSTWRHVLFASFVYILGYLSYCLPSWCSEWRSSSLVDSSSSTSVPHTPISVSKHRSSPTSLKRNNKLSKSIASPKSPCPISRLPLSDALKRQIAKECIEIVRSCESAFDDYERHYRQDLSWAHPQVEFNLEWLRKRDLYLRQSGWLCRPLPPHCQQQQRAPTTLSMNNPLLNDDEAPKEHTVHWKLPRAHKDKTTREEFVHHKYFASRSLVDPSTLQRSHSGILLPTKQLRAGSEPKEIFFTDTEFELPQINALRHRVIRRVEKVKVSGLVTTSNPCPMTWGYPTPLGDAMAHEKMLMADTPPLEVNHTFEIVSPFLR